MARFRYRALDAAGAMEAGEIECVDEGAALARLRMLGKLPIEIAPARGGGLMALLNAEITPRDAFPAADRVAFTRSLATLIGAGLPLDRALETVRDLGERRSSRRVADGLLDAVRGGAALSEAMERREAAFPPIYRGMVRAGEAAAALGPALARLADSEEAAAKRRGALRSALIYPAFLVVSSIGAVAVLLIFVVPTFEPMLADAGVAPPVATRIVMGAGRVAAQGWPWMLAAALALGLGGALALRSPRARLLRDRALLGLPVAGGLLRKLQTARFARLLGELLTSGVALPTALRLAAEALGEGAFRAELVRARPDVEAGRGLAAPLSDGGLLSPLALQLIRVGEESGRLAPMLLKAADILDDEARGALDRLMAMLTPVLTLVMGAVIALIVSSILFALFSINELAIGRP